MRGRLILLLLLLVIALGSAAGWIDYRITAYDDMISLSAARYDLDFYLVKALIFEESWFSPDARGSSGELGLMQITKAAAADYTTRRGFIPFYEGRLLEPELNLEIGCWYLRQSLDRYRDSPDPILFGLLRYNAGAARADGWLHSAVAKPVPRGIPPEQFYLSLVDLPKTREYVRRILKHSRSHNFWF